MMLDIIKSDKYLRECLEYLDVVIYDDFRKPLDLDGRISYSMNGKAFASTGAGDEYILLEDDTAAVCGSDGECGRIAESIEGFFSLVINFPCYWDFLNPVYYTDGNKERFARAFAQVMEENGYDDQQIGYISKKLNIPRDNDILKTASAFYTAAEREPKFEFSIDGEKSAGLFIHVVKGYFYDN